MRECWVNVYPKIPRPDGVPGPYLGCQAATPLEADEAAIGWGGARLLDVREKSRNMRLAGVGYRLHVRLKPEPVENGPNWAGFVATASKPFPWSF